MTSFLEIRLPELTDAVPPAVIAESPAPDAPVTPATCPLCHTADLTMTSELLAAGGDWRCRVCQQSWTARRLETAATYARFVENGSVFTLVL
jgi:predicted Zn finger-like uncharacterized protein